ncbi:MAG: Bug family tripartite tricarboxylate transporter substrate binding protein [Pseudolabrys sp.]
MDRRSFVIGSAASATALWTGQAGAQEAYPTRAITMISPFPPGGVSDTITRPLIAAMEPVLKQPVVLENKTGAAGAVGAQYVASAKPDGYTLLSHIVSISGFAAVDKLFGRAPKFTNENFIPLARIIADPIVLIVNKDTPYKTLKDLVEDAKKNPDKVIYSSSGLYGASHVPTQLFAKAAGDLKMRHLPTNGGGPAVTAVLGGNVNFFMSPSSIALKHVQADKVRALAVSSTQRSKALPNVPTFKELGYDLEYYFWVGIFAPKGTPAPAVAKLREALNAAAHSKAFSDFLKNVGQDLAYLDQPQFATFWAEDSKRQEAAINAIGKVQG